MRFTLLIFITSLLYSNYANAELEVGSIDHYEMDQISTRRHSLNLSSIAFGPAQPINLGTSDMMYSLSLSGHREVTEHAEVRIRWGGEFSESGSAYGSSATLGAAFFPLRGNLTPIVGAEFGFGFFGGRNVNKITSGFIGSAIFGVRLFRTSDTQMEAVGRYSLLRKKNDIGNPGSFGVQLAVLL